MAEHDLTINQDGVFGQLENLLTEQETQLIEEQDQEIEVEQESDPEQTEEQEEEDQEQEQEQVQEQKQEKEHVDAPVVDKWPGWPGESVYRMLVPSQKVGGIIGRKGEFIKKMCEEAKARIKILDATGTPERAVLVSAKEEPDLSIPPAIDGLLRVHKRIVDGLDESSHAPASGVKVTTRLLVPAVQAGNLIGKQGTTVKSIQEASNCVVRITEDLPSFALQDDRIVEVVGEPTAVHKAVELVACHLRKFLVDRSIIPIFEQQMQTVNPPPQMDHHVPIQQSWGPPQFVQNVPVPNYRATTPTYRAHTQFAPPLQQQHNSYYQPAEMAPPLEKQPHQGISAYGREAPLSSNNQPSQSMNTQQVVQQIQIPLLYADAVIGNAGGTISYIRRASGATVTIQETRGVPGEMTVEITGNASQVQTAQQLIQNYMADAAAPGTGQAQPAAAAATVDQSYNPYATTATAAAAPPALGGGGGAAYASQTTNPSLGYGSVYGTNYGY